MKLTKKYVQKFLENRKKFDTVLRFKILNTILIMIVLISFIINYQNWFSFIPLGFVTIFFIISKPQKNEIIVLFGIVTLFIILCLFVPKEYDHNFLFTHLENNIDFFWLRSKLNSYLDTKYTNVYTKGIIKLFVLNIKSKEISDLLQTSATLDLFYLFTISGVHINLVLTTVKFCFKKFKIICEIIQWILIINLSYMLRFSISLIRIISTKIFSYFYEKKEKAITSAGILNSLVFVNVASNFGFVLSYGCTLLIERILRIKLKNHLNLLVIPIVCSLFSSLILFSMNNKINLLSFLYNIALSPLILLWYVWTQLTYLIIPLENVQAKIYDCFLFVLEQLEKIEVSINLNLINCQILIIFCIPFIYLLTRT